MTEPADSAEGSGRPRLRVPVAVGGGLSSAALVMGFYLPGVDDSGGDLLSAALLLAFPAAALALPFAMLALLRSSAVLATASVLMLGIAVLLGYELFFNDNQPGASPLLLLLLFLVELLIAAAALGLDLLARAAHRNRRSS